MNDTKQNSSGAALYDHLPAMELVLNSAKELGKEIRDRYFSEALYQMYCA